jgi:hypothetical protein
VCRNPAKSPPSTLTAQVLVVLVTIAVVASACGGSSSTATNDERRRASATTDSATTDTGSTGTTTGDAPATTGIPQTTDTPPTAPPETTTPATTAPPETNEVVDLEGIQVGFENSYLETFDDPTSARCFAEGLIDLIGPGGLAAEGVTNEAEAFDYANAPSNPVFEDDTYEIIYSCVSPAEFGPIVAGGIVENPTPESAECMGQVFLDPSNRATLRRFVDFPGLAELIEDDEQAAGVIGTALLCLNRAERQELMAPITAELDPTIADCASEEFASNQNFTLIFLAVLKGEIDENDPNDPGVRAITDVVETCTA